jgi:hypothetical protein
MVKKTSKFECIKLLGTFECKKIGKQRIANIAEEEKKDMIYMHYLSFYFLNAFLMTS